MSPSAPWRGVLHRRPGPWSRRSPAGRPARGLAWGGPLASDTSATTVYSLRCCSPCSGRWAGRCAETRGAVGHHALALRGAHGHAQVGLPLLQNRHSPHSAVERDHVVARLTLVTPSPTSTTMPAPSWPSTAGNRPSGSSPLGEGVGVADTGVGDLDEHLALLGRATSISTICRGSPAKATAGGISWGGPFSQSGWWFI